MAFGDSPVRGSSPEAGNLLYRRARALEAPPPASSEAEASKKVFFSFYLPAESSAQAGKKKFGARKRKAEKTFLLGASPPVGGQGAAGRLSFFSSF